MTVETISTHKRLYDAEQEVARQRQIIERVESHVRSIRTDLVARSVEVATLLDNGEYEECAECADLTIYRTIEYLDDLANANALNIGQPVTKGGE